jgi:hypothetical protein
MQILGVHAVVTCQVKARFHDYYGWIEYSFDFTFTTPQQWVCSGYDDVLIFEFAREWDDNLLASTHIEKAANDEYQAHTHLEKEYWRPHQFRVQSLPWQVGVDSMLHGLDQTILPDTVLVKLNSCWKIWI